MTIDIMSIHVLLVFLFTNCFFRSSIILTKGWNFTCKFIANDVCMTFPTQTRKEKIILLGHFLAYSPTYYLLVENVEE